MKVHSSSLTGNSATVRVREQVRGTTKMRAAITSLAPGLKYFLRVTAYNVRGHGLPSVVTSATPRSQPEAPASASLSVASATSLRLDFSAPTSTGGAPVTSYRVETYSSPLQLEQQTVTTSAQQGIAEVQEIETTATTNSIQNYFKLSFKGESTPDILHSASNTDVQTALLRLSTIGSVSVTRAESKVPTRGMVKVDQNANFADCAENYYCQFKEYMNDGDIIWIAGERFKVKTGWYATAQGNTRLLLGDYTTPANAATFAGASVAAVKLFTWGNGFSWAVTFGTGHIGDQPLLVATPSTGWTGSDVTLNVREVTKGLQPLSGSFTLSAAGNTGTQHVTAPIPHDASSVEVKQSLESLYSVGTVDVTRTTNGFGFNWLVTFTSDIGNLPIMHANGAQLTGPSAKVSVAETVQGALPHNYTINTTSQQFFVMGGLDTGKTYMMQVSAINSEGAGAVKLPTPFSQVPREQPKAPTSLSLAALSKTKLKITFSPPSDGKASGGATITEYRIQWDYDSSFANIATSGYTHVLTDLSAGSGDGPYFYNIPISRTDGYYVRVQAKNDQGWGPTASAGPVLGAFRVPGPPLTVSAQAISSRELKVMWSAPRDDLTVYGGNGGQPIQSYFVEWDTNWADMNAPESTYVSSGVYEYIIGGRNVQTGVFNTTLVPGTNYSARVTAFNAVGGGSAATASPALVQMADAAPTSPTSLSVAVASGTELTPSWNVPAHDGGKTLRDYKLEYDPYATFDSKKIITVASATTISAGTFRLGFGTEMTSCVAWNAADSVVESAIEALTDVYDVAVTRSGQTSNGYIYTVVFNNPVAPAHALTVPADQTACTSLTAGATVVATTESFGTSVLPLEFEKQVVLTESNVVNEVQTVSAIVSVTNERQTVSTTLPSARDEVQTITTFAADVVPEIQTITTAATRVNEVQWVTTSATNVDEVQVVRTDATHRNTIQTVELTATAQSEIQNVYVRSDRKVLTITWTSSAATTSGTHTFTLRGTNPATQAAVDQTIDVSDSDADLKTKFNAISDVPTTLVAVTNAETGSGPYTRTMTFTIGSSTTHSMLGDYTITATSGGTLTNAASSTDGYQISNVDLTGSFSLRLDTTNCNLCTETKGAQTTGSALTAASATLCADMQTQLRALSNVNGAHITVTDSTGAYDNDLSQGKNCTVTFANSGSSTVKGNVPQLEIVSSSVGPRGIVAVQTIQEGNEIQGTFTLAYNDEHARPAGANGTLTTAAITLGTCPASGGGCGAGTSVEEKLEALQSILGVTVTRSAVNDVGGYIYTIAFDGNNGDLPKLTCSPTLTGVGGASASGAACNVVKSQPGFFLQPWYYQDSHFTLTLGGQTTAAIPWNATTSELKAIAEAQSNFGTVEVSRTQYGLTPTWSGGFEWAITFKSIAGNVAKMTATNELYNKATNGATVVVKDASDNGETVPVDGNEIGGTFLLTSFGMTTANISVSATAEQFQTALNDVLGYGATSVERFNSDGSASGTGPSLGYRWQVTFQGDTYANVSGDVPMLAVAQSCWAGDVVGKYYNASCDYTTGSGANVAFQEAVKGNALFGTFRLKHPAGADCTQNPGYCTGDLAWNIQASQMEAQLEALDTIGDVTVSRYQTATQSRISAYTWSITFNSHTHDGTDTNLRWSAAGSLGYLKAWGVNVGNIADLGCASSLSTVNPSYSGSASCSVDEHTSGTSPIDGEMIVNFDTTSCSTCAVQASANVTITHNARATAADTSSDGTSMQEKLQSLSNVGTLSVSRSMVNNKVSSTLYSFSFSLSPSI